MISCGKSADLRLAAERNRGETMSQESWKVCGDSLQLQQTLARCLQPAATPAASPVEGDFCDVTKDPL